MSGLLDRIGEVLGLKKKPGTAAAAEPTDPKTTAQVPSGTGPGDENPDARPTIGRRSGHRGGRPSEGHDEGIGARR